MDQEETIRDQITCYFERGYEYAEIIHFLEEFHNIRLSKRTLLRRLNSYGLRRRRKEDHSNLETQRLQGEIRTIVNGPWSSIGYRTVWHLLKTRGIQVPRSLVEKNLKEVDPEGSEARRRHQLRRREYTNPGPDFAWHIDGHDKLKPFGFPIHGAIDGYSRRILWLKVVRSNNSPEMIASMYLDCVFDNDGCPKLLVTDLGTENGLAASLQCFFRQDMNAHRYVPSPRNQRIECWWSYFMKAKGAWWRNLFKDLQATNDLDISSDLEMACLWYCFYRVIQNDLDELKEHWNTHRIRKSRFDTISGKPEVLYFLPERSGGQKGLKLSVPTEEIEMVSEQTKAGQNDDDDDDDYKLYKEYFDNVKEEVGLDDPQSWEDSLHLFKELKDIGLRGR